MNNERIKILFEGRFKGGHFKTSDSPRYGISHQAWVEIEPLEDRTTTLALAHKTLAKMLDYLGSVKELFGERDSVWLMVGFAPSVKFDHLRILKSMLPAACLGTVRSPDFAAVGGWFGEERYWDMNLRFNKGNQITESQCVFSERAKAAFLGLALGDAFGRPLEFIRDDFVRAEAVQLLPGHFHWTDDTHMALHLGKAVLDIPPTNLCRDEFGTAVGRRFVEWSHDRLTPLTAPGGTCLAGAGNFEQTGKWAESGVLGSDGSGAVMRICPLAIAFDGQALIEAADISARVTHRHPNASAAAIAAAFMLSEIFKTGTFSAAIVHRAIDVLSAHADPRQSVTRALVAALKLADNNERWLDEASIPEGDGGWRCSSALGLAVAAALRWREGFEVVIDRAARIRGDSDTVACLAGMFTAAVGGPECLPKTWLDVLPQRQAIESLASDLANRPTIKFVSPTG